VKKAFLALLAVAAPGLARELTVTTQPAEVANWAEPVRIIVRGTSTTACGAAAATLLPPIIGPSGAPRYIQLREPCDVSGPVRAEPFTVSLDVGRINHGFRQLTVKDEHGAIAGTSLKVVEPGTAVVDVVGPATSDRPLTLRVRDFACPPSSSSVSVGEGVITLRYEKDWFCPTAGGPKAVDLELQTPAPLPAGSYELRTLATSSPFGGVGEAWEAVPGRVDVVAPGSCEPSDTTLCLHGRRFAVTVSWHDPAGNSGVGHAWETPADDGSGLFWFFSPDNAELTIKALDGCDLNQRWWVFLASGSNVDYEVSVRDTLSGQQRTYVHEAGDIPPLLTDLETFTGCS